MGMNGLHGASVVALAASLAVGTGCSASHADPEDAGGTRADSSVAARDSGPASTVDAGVGDHAGDVWEGYIESYHFMSGSDAVRIVFDSATGDGPRTGIVVFGAGTPPPPAIDPDVGYPLGIAAVGPSALTGPWEGFEYPIVSASVSGARVLVTIQLGALWARWCELQTPVLWELGGSTYACLPNTGAGGADPDCYLIDGAGAHTPIDCGKLELCQATPVCACDATSCRTTRVGEITFDFHVVGTNGDGSATLDGPQNVHLVRR